MCAEMNVPFLGAIPIDPLIARSCDEGKSFIAQAPDSPASKAYAAIFESTVLECYMFYLFGIST
jgi:MinD-like ATPase involved in chromosome partitioning or flagellar assembly